MPRISHGKTISGLVVGIFSSLILMELIRNYRLMTILIFLLS